MSIPETHARAAIVGLATQQKSNSAGNSYCVRICTLMVDMVATCRLCHRSFNESEGSTIQVRKGENIHVCPSCHGETFITDSRFTIDVMIVPVSDKSLNLAISRRQYIIPSKYIRNNASPKFIAFYRGGKVGAITHISMVKNIARNISRETLLNPAEYHGNEETIWMSHEEHDVFDLGPVEVLNVPITRQNAPPIQNRVYKTFLQFSKAKTLKDISGS